MKNTYLLAVCAALCLLHASAQAQQIQINEFARAGNMNTTDEYVEVVLTTTLTAAQLNGFFIGDSTGTTAAKAAGYRLQNMELIAANFLPGTLIVVSGQTGAAPDLTYDPFANDWNLILLTNNATHILSNGTNGDFAGADCPYVDTNGTNGDATLSPQGHAVNYHATPGAFGALAPVTIPATSNFSAAANMGALSGVNTPANWTTEILLTVDTPGEPNGGANTTDINAIRAAAVPVEISAIGLE